MRGGVKREEKERGKGEEEEGGESLQSLLVHLYMYVHSVTCVP